MAQHSRPRPTLISRPRSYLPPPETRNRLAILWSRESILRLLLSLVLAVALWLYVTDRQNPAVFTFGQPLAISPANLGSRLTVANNLPSAHATIRIPNRGQQVTAGSFHTFVNLLGLGAGLHRNVPVRVLADPGIQVVSVQPATVPVLIERRLTTHVPVRYHIMSPPGSGYSAGNITVNPSTLSVSGPRSLVSEVSQAAVYVDLSQAHSSIGGTYRPTLENSQGTTIQGLNRLTITPQQVFVHVAIQSVASYKTVPILATLHGHPANGLGVASVQVEPSNITATGSPRALGSIRAARTAAISLAHRHSGRFTVRVPIDLPHGVQSHTKSVRVTVSIDAISAGSAVEIAVVPIHLAPGLAVHTHPASILVTIVGPSRAVANAAKTLRASVNLAGKGPGTYHLTPAVHAPHLQIEGISPSSVTVQIRRP